MDVISLSDWSIFDDFEDEMDDVKYFHVFGNDDEMGALCVTYDDEVWGIGYNGPYNLLATTEQWLFGETTDDPVVIDSLCQQGIVCIAVGGEVASALTVDGRILFWGKSYVDGSCEVHYPHELRVDGEEFQRIACGDMFLAALSLSGKVYVWGSIHRNAAVCRQFLISGEVIMKSIDCGWYHMAMVSDRGAVYTTGFGSYGQLGRRWKMRERFLSANHVTLEGLCKTVVCGRYSTLFLLEDGSVFTSGKHDASFGYIGHDTDRSNIDIPCKVNLPEKILKAAANKDLVSNYAVISSTNKVYVWGMYRTPRVLHGSHLFEAFLNTLTPPYLEELVNRPERPRRRRAPQPSQQRTNTSSNVRTSSTSHNSSHNTSRHTAQRTSTSAAPSGSNAVASIVQDILDLQDEVQSLFKTFSALLDRNPRQ